MGLNMNTTLKDATPAQLAQALRDKGMAVVVFGPGDMEGYGNPELSLQARLDTVRNQLQDQLTRAAWDIIHGILGSNEEEA